MANSVKRELMLPAHIFGNVKREPIFENNIEKILGKKSVKVESNDLLKENESLKAEIEELKVKLDKISQPKKDLLAEIEALKAGKGANNDSREG